MIITVGTNELWCGIVAGGVVRGTLIGKGAQLGGEALYENIYNK